MIAARDIYGRALQFVRGGADNSICLCMDAMTEFVTLSVRYLKLFSRAFTDLKAILHARRSAVISRADYAVILCDNGAVFPPQAGSPCRDGFSDTYKIFVPARSEFFPFFHIMDNSLEAEKLASSKILRDTRPYSLRKKSAMIKIIQQGTARKDNKDNMEERRRHKRFSMDIMEINGKMVLASYIKILDISIGGVSFKANRRLNMGTEYSLKMENKGVELTVKGTIVRSTLSESIKDQRGNFVPVYAAGMQFTDVSEEKIKEIEAFILNNMKDADKQVDLHDPSGRRLYVRVFIENPEQSVLKIDEHYKVKNISLGGMLIESEHPLEIESAVPLEIYFIEDKTLKVTGRVVSCIMITDQEPMHYNIGMEFIEIPGKYGDILLEFIRSLDKPAG
jgi:hypothetical protein